MVGTHHNIIVAVGVVWCGVYTEHDKCMLTVAIVLVQTK